MPYPERPLEPGRSAADWFGAELRQWRKLRCLSQARLGRSVHVSGDLIGSIEAAKRTCPPGLPDLLDNVLDTGGVLARAHAHVRGEADSPPSEADTGRADPASEVRHGVLVDRRDLLRAGTTAAVAPLAVPPDITAPGDVDAVLMHLGDMWHMLVRSDNLLGPQHALQGVHQQLTALQRLLVHAAPARRADVLRLASRYAESAAWLHEDIADPSTATSWTRQPWSGLWRPATR